MKFEIEVPDLASANLDNQSEELKKFLKQLYDFLRSLCDNFQAVRPGIYTFQAFLREDAYGIINVRDGDRRYMFSLDTWTKDIQEFPEDILNDWVDPDFLDQPGNWMVLRLVYPNITGTGQSIDKYVTLRSKDFEDCSASQVFAELLSSLMDFCHTVPELNAKLREAMRILQ